MNTLAIATILAMGGTIVSFWQQIKGMFERISGHVITSVSVDGYMANAFNLYLVKTYKKSPFGKTTLTASNKHVRPLKREQIVGYEIPGPFCVYWHGWRPIWATLDKRDGRDSGVPSPSHGITVSFVRGTFDLKEMAIAALDFFNASVKDSSQNGAKARYDVTYIYGQRRDGNSSGNGREAEPMSVNARAPMDDAWDGEPLKWKPEEIGQPLSPLKNPTDVIIPTGDVAEALEEARFWRKSEEWYKSKGITWAKGFAFEGKHGTGKTTTARALAQELDLPVFIFDISSLTNEELRNGWKRMMRCAPVMALIEDIDGTFVGRENITAKGHIPGVTFDCLLNVMDGIERCDGLMIVITTNFIEKLDAALLRPGRVDRIVTMTAPDRAGLMVVAKRIMDELPHLWDKMVDDAFEKKMTVAEFQKSCETIAVKHLWDSFKSKKNAPAAITPKPALRWIGVEDEAIRK